MIHFCYMRINYLRTTRFKNRLKIKNYIRSSPASKFFAHQIKISFIDKISQICLEFLLLKVFPIMWSPNRMDVQLNEMGYLTCISKMFLKKYFLEAFNKISWKSHTNYEQSRHVFRQKLRTKSNYVKKCKRNNMNDM